MEVVLLVLVALLGLLEPLGTLGARTTLTMDQPKQLLPETDLQLLTPATVLLYVALVVGVLITLCFMFFTLRYFIRAKYGLHVYGLRRNHNGWGSGGTSDAEWETITHHRDFLVHELQLRFLTRHGNLVTTRGGRRRRLRFAKMKKLLPAQVEELFPARTYKQWLQTSADDADNDNNDVMLTMIVVEEDPDNHNDHNHVDATTEKGVGEEKHQLQTALAPCDSVELQFDLGGCAICLEPFEDDEIVRGLICGHPFHAECLDPWLTRRRACCPMCKRDYYQKQEEGAEPPTTSDLALDFSIDLDAFRDDPDVRSMLQQLIPPESRVRHLLQDPEVQRLGIEAEAQDLAKKKYGGWGKRVWWKLMGISKQDLANWEFLHLYEQSPLARRGPTNPPEAPPTTETVTQTVSATETVTETTATETTATEPGDLEATTIVTELVMPPSPVHVRSASPSPSPLPAANPAVAAARMAVVQNRV